MDEFVYQLTNYKYNTVYKSISKYSNTKAIHVPYANTSYNFIIYLFLIINTLG